MQTTPPNALRRAAFAAMLSAAVVPFSAWGWGAPHVTITRAAVAALPAWQKQLLNKELSPLGDRYCLIPDTVFTDAENAAFATMTNSPGVRYLKILHVPAAPLENGEVLRYFVGRAAAAFGEGRTGDAARYAGTLAHVLEDWGCPAHAVPGDNMFTLFKQLLPPPEAQQFTLLHSPVESGTFSIDLGDYQPRLLGTSIDEAAFNLLLRAQGATVHARSQVIPIIQSLYAGNSNAVNAAQQVAAAYDARMVADALYTLCCLGQKRFDGAAALDTVDLSLRFPLEAPDLYMPQITFFSRPYWGHATAGVILHEGRPEPLRLNVSEHGLVVPKRYDSGIGTGTRSALTYPIPSGVYERFTAQVGLHADLGKSGQVLFEVWGNGFFLAKLGPITGAGLSQVVDVPLAGVTNLQLTVTSAGGDGSGNYAVWGEPKLHKLP